MSGEPKFDAGGADITRVERIGEPSSLLLIALQVQNFFLFPSSCLVLDTHDDLAQGRTLIFGDWGCRSGWSPRKTRTWVSLGNSRLVEQLA